VWFIGERNDNRLIPSFINLVAMDGDKAALGKNEYTVKLTK